MRTITIPPEGYGHQSRLDIQIALDSIGWVKPYSPHIIYDLANVIAARQLDVEPEYMEIPEDSEDKKYFENLIKFLDAIDPALISGHSPIQKAVYFNASLENLDMNTTKNEKAKSELTQKPAKKASGLIQNKIIAFVDDAEDLLTDKTDAQSGIAITDIDPLDAQSGKESNDYKIDILVGGATGKDGDNKDIDPERMVLDMQKSVCEIREFAATQGAEYCGLRNTVPEVMPLTDAVRKMINNLSILKSRKQIHHVKNPETATPVKMNTYSQVARLHAKSTMLHPTFDLKFLTKQVLVKKKEKKGTQDVVFLIDASSSMGTHDKVAWVRALLMDRFDEVIKGGCKLYVIPYEFNAYTKQTMCFNSKEDVQKNLNWLPKFNMGNTNIQKAIEQVIDAIKTKSLGKYPIIGQSPEIVVILDGHDKVARNFTPKHVVHAFILGRNNNDVRGMAKRSGGTYELLYNETA